MLCKLVKILASITGKILFFLRTEGMENIPHEGGVVLCPNHRSNWDAVLIAAAARRPLAYIGKAELFENKLFAYFLRKMHCYPVKRGGGDLAIVKTALSLLKNGEALVIFPEGERIRKGKTPNPKPGALRLAIMAGVPLVPMGIGGNFKLFRKMHVKAGEAIDTSVYQGKRFSEEEYKAMISDIMQTIYSLAETEQKHD